MYRNIVIDHTNVTIVTETLKGISQNKEEGKQTWYPKKVIDNEFVYFGALIYSYC